MSSFGRSICLRIVCVLAAGMLSACAHPGSAADLTARIKEVADAYDGAFNRRDAAAVAALWTEDGEFADQTTGLVMKGRKRILRRMQRTFAAEANLEAETVSLLVQPVAADVAVAQGLAQFTHENGPVEAAAFVTLYVKRGATWKIHRIWQTELEVDSHYEQLADIAWMIGEWTDDKEGKQTRNICRWTKNRNFITRSFEVSDGGAVLGKGTEVIGWDPIVKRIRSWTFDSRGGFAECVWDQVDGDGRWRPDKITDHAPDDLARHQEALQGLAWMVGKWVSRGDVVAVESSCRWASGRAFLLRRFKASRPGQQEHAGLIVIGWDPLAKRIRSWMFDTDGGYAESVWSREGDQWTANARHVLHDGRIASSIMVSRRDGDDAMVWQKVSQEVDGEVLPAGPEVRLVRDATGNQERTER